MKKILVVDDIDINRDILYYMLSEYCEELDIIMVDNGHDAIKEYIDSTQNKKEIIKTILLDIAMPEMDGISVLKTIRKYEKDNNLKNVPIIMVTAHKDKFECSFLEYCDDFITKPINVEKLEHKLDSYL